MQNFSTAKRSSNQSSTPETRNCSQQTRQSQNMQACCKSRARKSTHTVGIVKEDDEDDDDAYRAYLAGIKLKLLELTSCLKSSYLSCSNAHVPHLQNTKEATLANWRDGSRDSLKLCSSIVSRDHGKIANDLGVARMQVQKYIIEAFILVCN